MSESFARSTAPGVVPDGTRKEECLGFVIFVFCELGIRVGTSRRCAKTEVSIIVSSFAASFQVRSFMLDSSGQVLCHDVCTYALLVVRRFVGHVSRESIIRARRQDVLGMVTKAMLDILRVDTTNENRAVFRRSNLIVRVNTFMYLAIKLRVVMGVIARATTRDG